MKTTPYLTGRHRVGLVLLLCTAAVACPAENNDLARTVAGEGRDRGMTARMTALRGLPDPLTEGVALALLPLINAPESFTNLGPQQEAFLMNELLNKLAASPLDQSRLAGALIDMYRDERRSPALKDYALQHLASSYPVSRRQQEIINLMFEALHEKKGTVAGTSLRSLQRLAGGHVLVSRVALGRAAHRIALNPEYSLSSRVAAVQACGVLENDDALPLVRDLASHPDSPALLRNAALYALGRLGTPADARRVERWVNKGGLHAAAAVAALKSLVARHGANNVSQEGMTRL